MPSHPLTYLKIQKYYQDEPKFNGDNLTDKIKNEAFIINLDEYSNIGAHCIALYALTFWKFCCRTCSKKNQKNYWEIFD